MSEVVETRIFSVPLECRYLIQAPQPPPAKPAFAVALHGYASNPEAMLQFTADLLGPGWVVAAPQAPFQHYVTHPAEGRPGYNWGIRQHWESAVRLHHEMVSAVLDAVSRDTGIPVTRSLLVGFSQSVGLNYRFCGTYPDRAGAVLGICGGLPRDWDEEKYKPVTAPILHISRDDDEFYPVAVASGFPGRLRLHAADVEFHLLPGKHRFPSKADVIVRPWLDRVFGLSRPPREMQ